MICKRCGHSIPEGAATCPNCGRVLPTGDAEPPIAPQPDPAPPLFREVLRLDETERDPGPPRETGPEAAQDSHKRRRLSLGAAATLLVALLAVVTAVWWFFLPHGATEPVLYLTEDRLMYLSAPESEPLLLLDGVESAAVGLSQNGAYAYIITADYDLYRAALNGPHLGAPEDGGLAQKIDSGLSYFDLASQAERNPSGALKLIDPHNNWNFYISPDGRRACYLKRQGDRSDLYLYDGRESCRLEMDVTSFQVSEDGSTLLITSDRSEADARFLRRSMEPDAQAEVLIEARGRMFTANRDFSEVFFLTYDWRRDNAGGDNVYTLYVAGPDGKPETLASDLANVLYVEGRDHYAYVVCQTEELPLSRFVLDDRVGDHSFDPLRAAIERGTYQQRSWSLWLHENGTDRMLCDQMVDYYVGGSQTFIQSRNEGQDIFVCFTFDPPQPSFLPLSGISSADEVTDWLAAQYGYELTFVPREGEQWRAGTHSFYVGRGEDGAVYLEEKGDLVRYSSDFQERTVLKTGISNAFATIFPDTLYCTVLSGETQALYRISGGQEQLVAEGLARGGWAMTCADGGLIFLEDSSTYESAPLLTYYPPSGDPILCGKLAGRQAYSLLEERRLLLLSSGGALVLYGGETPVPLAEHVRSFCTPGVDPLFDYSMW